MLRELKVYLRQLWKSGAKPGSKQHPEDAEMWRAGVKEMAGLEEELLEDFGPELARMVLVYPDAAASEMLATLREHVWLRDWRRARSKARRPLPIGTGAK